MVSTGVKATFLVGSNAAFLLPAITAFRHGMLLEGTIYLMMGIVSSIYHIVDTIPGTKIIFDYHTWQNDDFYLAFYLIPVATMMLMFSTGYDESEAVWKRNMKIKPIVLFLLGLVAITFVMEGDSTPTMVLVLSILSLIISTIAIIFWRESIRIDFIDFAFMWGFIILGALCFFLCGGCSNYWIWHSIWHICAAIGIFFAVETENTTWNIINFITCGKYCRIENTSPPPSIPIYSNC